MNILDELDKKMKTLAHDLIKFELKRRVIIEKYKEEEAIVNGLFQEFINEKLGS